MKEINKELEIIPKEDYSSLNSGTKMLLGIRKDNEKIYLTQASWDCGWYWGFGYIGTPNEHYHFSSLMEDCGLDTFKKEFKASVLNEKDLWVLFDLMKSFYILKDASELFHSGFSHYTTHNLNLKDKDRYKSLIQLQKKVILEIQKLLGYNGGIK